MRRSITGVHRASKLDHMVISQGATVRLFLKNTAFPAMQVFFVKS